MQDHWYMYSTEAVPRKPGRVGRRMATPGIHSEQLQRLIKCIHAEKEKVTNVKNYKATFRNTRVSDMNAIIHIRK